MNVQRFRGYEKKNKNASISKTARALNMQAREKFLNLILKKKMVEIFLRNCGFFFFFFFWDENYGAQKTDSPKK